MKIFIKKVGLIAILLLTISCYEEQTKDPIKTYQFWTGSKAPKEFKLIKGQYWQSAHWTKEYIMSLKMRPTKKWWDSFVEQNNLKRTNEKWIKPSDLPNWFNPSKNSIEFKINDNFDQGSRYFCDYKTGICYIYEIQL